MRSASTTARTEEIQQLVKSDNMTSAEVIIEVYFNSQWNIIEDLDTDTGITFTESGKRTKFANFSLIPLTGTIKFDVWNYSGKYSEGSGTSVESIFDNDTKVRLRAGYRLSSTTTAASTGLDLNDVSGLVVRSFYHHTQYTGGYVGIDSSSITTQPTHFLSKWNNYDSINYDAGLYSPDAYFVETYDTEGIGYKNISQFTVTANNTAGEVFYRSFNENDGLDTSFYSQWTSAGATTNGTKTVSVDIEKRFLQIAVLYDGITWSDDYRVTAMTVTTGDYIEIVYKSVYYLDSPGGDDPKEPIIPKIFCEGRDVYKRAISQEINLPDMSGGGALQADELIKFIADQVNIPYTADSIADLSSFGDITWSAGLTDAKTADSVFELVMSKLKTGYQMYTLYDSTTDDNVLYVQPKPSTFVASGAFSYKNYDNIGNIQKNYDRLLNRFTILTDSQVVDAEVSLKQTAFTTTGAKTMTWTGGAVYKRITIDKPNDITISALQVDNEQISFTIDAITGTVTITVYGNKFISTEPTYYGESINLDNMINGKGTTSRQINPLMESDTEARQVPESFISKFGTPAYESNNLVWPYLNLLPEINDLYLLWRRFVFVDDLYFITKISHSWNRSASPNQKTSFNLEDSGNAFSDQGASVFKYGNGISKYGAGYVYDMKHNPGTSDAVINAQANNKHNIDFS